MLGNSWPIAVTTPTLQYVIILISYDSKKVGLNWGKLFIGESKERNLKNPLVVWGRKIDEFTHLQWMC